LRDSKGVGVTKICRGQVHVPKKERRRERIIIIIIITRGSQEPVIAHLVFNLTAKVDRKWGHLAMSSLTYILGFSVRFFQPVYSV
jgi:hypothetical protein